MSRKLIATAAAALFSFAVSPAWAINKCTIDGQVVFQDAACPGKGETLTVRPASGRGAAAADTATVEDQTTKKHMTEAQRIEGKVKDSQDSRRKRELEERLVPDTKQAIWSQRKSCDSEFAALRNKKRFANNNLAGATWENSISSEMAAVATRCDSKARELELKLEAFKKECAELGGCQR